MCVCVCVCVCVYFVSCFFFVKNCDRVAFLYKCLNFYHSAHRFVLFSVVYYIFNFEGGLFQQQKSPFSVCCFLLLLLFVGCCLFLLLFRLFGFGLVVVVLGWMG